MSERSSKATQASQELGLPADDAFGPRLQMKQQLAGMSYQDQLDAVRPAPTVQLYGGGPKIQFVGGAKLIASIKASTPSTYDSGGGHSYKDHGAHTTKTQHKTRLSTGVAPSGRQSPVPNSAPGSSKFDSDDLHKNAITKAVEQLVEKNKNKTNLKGIGGKIGVSGAGTIYTRDDKEEAATDVHVDLQKVSDTEFNLNTAFPTK